MYKQQIKNILAQDRSSFPLKDYQQQEAEEEDEVVDFHTQIPVMESAQQQQQQQQVYPIVMDNMMMDQSENRQYFTDVNIESFAAPEPIVTVSEMNEKISELEKSNSNLHSKIDNLTLELQNFRKDFASQFQELKQKLFDDQIAKVAKAVEQQQQQQQQNQPKSPKSVKFAIDEDEATNPRKRPSSSDEQQPATKKPAFSDDTVAFSQKFVKGKATTSKKKDLNVVQDLILVLVWIMKLSRLLCGVFSIKNLSEIDQTNTSNYACSFARWMNCLKEGLTEEEEELIQTLAKNIKSEDLQKFKTGSSFCNSDKTKRILDTKPALFTDDYDFGKCKLTKISYVSTLLAIFTKCGTTISTLFRALRKTNNDDYIDLIFKKLHSVVSASKFVTELGNLACICTSCKTRVVDVFCDSCKYMSACSVCYNKNGYVGCTVCKTKMNKVMYGYSTETPINSSDKSTSMLYSSSVRTIPRIQASTKNFSSKHKNSGLIGKTCDSELKSKDDDTIKAFVSFVTSVERTLMKSLGAVETFLKQGNSKGLRLCDSCRSTVATKRLRYKPANEKETIIAVCDGCFEDKTDNSTEDSPFIRFSRDSLYRGANMSLTAATLQLDLSSVPLDSRHQGYLKKDNKRSNADAVCSKYNIDAQSRSQEDSVLTLKTVLKQIVSWGADKDHDMETYFNHVQEKMSLCWPVNNNHLIELFIENNEIQTKEVDYELFFNKSARTLIQPQFHEKEKEHLPHPYVKQILQILKVEDDDNKKTAGLKAVLKESDVCVCDESVIVIGKLFRGLESSKLLSDLDEDNENYEIVGFYNKKFHPHPSNLKKKIKQQKLKKRKQQKSKTSPKKSKSSSSHKEDLDLPETLSSDEEENQQQEDLDLSESSSDEEEEEQVEQQEAEKESATDTLTNILEQDQM